MNVPKHMKKSANIPEFKTCISSMTQYEDLISEGFEVKNVYYKFPPGIIIIRLVKGSQEIIAESNSISDYIMHLKPLYDIEKKKNSFVFVPELEVYNAYEEALPMMLTGAYPRPIVTKSVKTMNSNKIYRKLLHWTRQIGDKYNKVLPSEIFSLVCVIEEKNKIIKTRTLGKELLSVEDISNLHERALFCENSIAFSFFMLRDKTESNNPPTDVIIGVIAYDLKSKCTLVFNLQSITSYILEFPLRKERGFYDIVNHLFMRSVDKNLSFKSYIPLPIHTPWYTALPWITYLALLPAKNDNNSNALNIPEFFTFGFLLFPNPNTFRFSYFSNTKKGRATCVLNFLEGKGIRPYNLRIDQSLGQRLIHVDYSYYDDHTEVKLIAHRPLDFEEVYAYNKNLFIAMMFAGIFDAHFTTLIKSGIKGLQKLASKNSAYLYPAYFLYIIERFAKELDASQYNTLQKLLDGKSVDQNEFELVNKIAYGDFRVAVENEDGTIGITLIGYAVLVRYKRGQGNISIT